MADEGKRLGNRGGDFLIHIESEQKCLSSTQITGKTAAATIVEITDIVAIPLVGNEPAYQGDEASVDGFIIWGNPIRNLVADASTAEIPPYTIIDAFDGAVLNQSVIPLADPAGAAWTGGVAAIVTAVTALGAKFVTEPTKTSTQTN